MKLPYSFVGRKHYHPIYKMKFKVKKNSFLATSAPHQQPIQEGLNLVIGIRASRLNESAVLLQIGKQSGKYGPAGSTAQLVCPNLTLCCYQRNATWAWFTIQECNRKNKEIKIPKFCHHFVSNKQMLAPGLKWALLWRVLSFCFWDISIYFVV